MLFLAVNHGAVHVQLDFRHLAFFRFHGENDMGGQGTRKILANSVYLLFNVQLQRRGWLRMTKSHGNSNIAHSNPTPEVICVGTVAGVSRRGGCPSPRDISPRCAVRYRWNRLITWKRYVDRCMACADLQRR